MFENEAHWSLELEEPGEKEQKMYLLCILSIWKSENRGYLDSNSATLLRWSESSHSIRRNENDVSQLEEKCFV